jgi:ribonuclease M5
MNDKEKIREVIVVEGRHDTENLRKYYDCETIETGGTSLGKDVLEKIGYAKKTRGVIVFTDPDSPGNRIRHQVNDAVSGCLNAYVQKKDARTSKKVGIEHASYEVLDAALNNLMSTAGENTNEITMQDMLELGLTGRKDSSERRMKIGTAFHIGFGNAKTMRRRINFLGVTKEELTEALK